MEHSSLKSAILWWLGRAWSHWASKVQPAKPSSPHRPSSTASQTPIPACHSSVSLSPLPTALHLPPPSSSHRPPSAAQPTCPWLPRTYPPLPFPPSDTFARSTATAAPDLAMRSAAFAFACLASLGDGSLSLAGMHIPSSPPSRLGREDGGKGIERIEWEQRAARERWMSRRRGRGYARWRAGGGGVGWEMSACKKGLTRMLMKPSWQLTIVGARRVLVRSI